MALPSEYPEVQSYPNLKTILKDQVDMQVEDLRGLLRFPIKGSGVETGFNLTAGALMLNLIAGSSVCFYNASIAGLKNRGERRTRFEETIKGYYYSQSVEVLTSDELTNALWDSTRNPLVHALGFDEPPSPQNQGDVIFLVKSPLSETQVAELESYPARPSFLASTPTVEKRLRVDGVQELRIHVSALYWGLHQMLHRLFKDPAQVGLAEILATHLLPHLNKYSTVPIV